MWRIRGWWSDEADAVDPSNGNPVARDDSFSPLSQFDAALGGAGAHAPLLSNDASADAGGGSGPQPLVSRVATMADGDQSANLPTAHIAYDPLVASLDGLLSNAAPADAGGPTGGGSGPQSLLSGVAQMAGSELLSNLQPLASDVAAMSENNLSPNPPTLHVAYDPLAAFLDGLNGFQGLSGAGSSAFLQAGPPAASLSNGLSADAGVAQLVSALARATDGNSAFNETPFAPPSNPEPQIMVAAATQ